MRQLEIPNLPDELFDRIERRARQTGLSLAEQATQILARGLSADESEEALVNAIRKDRERLANQGVFMTDAELRAAIEQGRE
jgi:plasmid stability protein